MTANQTYHATEVKPGLYQIGSVLGPRYVYQYLLVDEAGSILIDTGMPDTPEKAILPFMRDIGLEPAQLRAILISHADVDHFSGLENLRKFCTNAMVMAHAADVPWIESVSRICRERYFAYESLGVAHDEENKRWFVEHLRQSRVDLQLRGGEVLQLSGERQLDILHLPGHSPGHLGVYDRKNRTAIIIDGVLWRGLFDSQGKNVISPPPYYSIQPYLDSIDRLLQLDIDCLLTGHYEVLSGQDAYRFLHESKRFVEEVSDAVEEVVRSGGGPVSLADVLDATNQKVGPYTVMAVELIGPVYAHLLDLERQGKIHRTMQGTIPCWYA